MQKVKATTIGLIAAIAVLATLGAGVVTILVRQYDLEKASSIVTVVGLPLALVGFLLAFLTVVLGFKASSPVPETLDEIADQLAIAVRGQWEPEGEARRFQRPQFLSISWVPAAEELISNWSLITRLAESWPKNFVSDPRGWARNIHELSGKDDQLADYLMRRIPTSRLVVLGEAGSGKTVLLIRALLEILAWRSSGDPVPVLITMDSWNPDQNDFLDWIEAQVVRDYPGLKEPAPGVAKMFTRAAALLDSRKLILLLDGLDEIPRSGRGRAIGKINEALRPGQAVVLSSRAIEYSEAINDPAGARLTGSTGVSLVALDPAAAAEYLTQDAGDSLARSRWNRVIAELEHGGPLASALRTPLMVGLTRTIYSPRPGEPLPSVPNPDELCDSAKFPDEAEITKHLLGAFIPAVYRSGSHWQPAQAERWLTFLATHLKDPPSQDIRWWELRNATPKYLSSGVASLITGSVAGIVAGFGGKHLGSGIGMGIFVGITIALIVKSLLNGRNAFVTKLLLNAQHGLAAGFAGGVVGGLIGGLVGGIANKLVFGSSNPPTIGLIGGIEAGLAVGPIGGLIGGLSGGVGGGIAVAIFAGRGSGAIAGVIDGLAVALVVALSIEARGRRTPSKGLRSLHWSPFGAVAGLGVGLAVGITLGLGINLGLTAGLVTGTISGLATGMVAGLGGEPADLTEASSPQVTFRRDRGVAWLTGGATALALGLTAGIGIQPSVGIAAGLGFGLTVGFLQAATGPFDVTCLWLAARRRLPLRAMKFMVDAHQKRGVLRQVGTVYQFRHSDLQRRLASQNGQLARAASSRIRKRRISP